MAQFFKKNNINKNFNNTDITEYWFLSIHLRSWLYEVYGNFQLTFKRNILKSTFRYLTDRLVHAIYICPRKKIWMYQVILQSSKIEMGINQL